MKPTGIREEVQAFIHGCEAFTGFALYNRLTPAEREAIDNLVRGMGSDKPYSDDRRRSYLPIDG